MNNNPLRALQKFGQSFWYDNISRGILKSGELKRMIEEEGVRGVTSNPSIFYKSIKSGSDYDEQLKELFIRNPGMTDKEVFVALAITDIKDACNLLMPVYEESGGADGFVSIEVDPHLAYDTEGTVKDALELFEDIKMPNLMVKVPATKEGLPAIEELIYLGKNINVTLLFSVKRYEEVAEAYLKGLERRADEGKPLNNVNSVASFFVSRVDTLADKYLEEKLNNAKDGPSEEKIRTLMGKAAVANAQLAYESFKMAFSSDWFLYLKRKDAKIQRLLWGSTSTKNPRYSDILYVRELIGPGTVNTMPDDTWKAFKDHGRVERTIDRDIDGAKSILNEIESLGISMSSITKELEDEGVRLFAESFDSLIALIKQKREELS
ncbi:transaldolase [bacterium BMS3Bbin06]|nr:transaldolase [bacterium BMS3Abin08]GBE34829.1 transaldolase [bacterium BMS3Bbin06]HDO34785.1 transaldolase [Nitrospirota bacterium]HDY71265.1 transaldolase [Nitrospirota bacterium]